MITPLEKLAHDVRSRCASLKSAADLLESAPTAERAELLELMTQQARLLVRDLEAFGKGR